MNNKKEAITNSIISFVLGDMMGTPVQFTLRENLQQTISLLSRSIQNQIETVDEAQNVAKILGNFAKGLDLSNFWR